jgi:hypothetical protein
VARNLKAHKGLVFLSLLLFAIAVSVPRGSAWTTTLTLAGPSPLYLGMNAQFVLSVKNIGSPLMRVDSVSLQFDWMHQPIQASDIPQALETGTWYPQTYLEHPVQYSWTFNLHVPIEVTAGEHVVTVIVHASDPDEHGGWIQSSSPGTITSLWEVVSQPVALTYRVDWGYSNPSLAGQSFVTLVGTLGAVGIMLFLLIRLPTRKKEQ